MTEIDQKQLKNKYSFHDGLLENIVITTEAIILKFELLNMQTKDLQFIQLKFKQYTNLVFEEPMDINQENVSAGILNYEFINSSVSFFLEITNYETDEVAYSNLKFDYKTVTLE